MLRLVFGFLIAMVVTAWGVRGLTLLLGPSKTSPVNRLDDIAQDETLPLNELPASEANLDEQRRSPVTLNFNHIPESPRPPSPAAETSRVRGPGIDLPASPQRSSDNLLRDVLHVNTPTPAQKAAAFISAYVDSLTWGVLWAVGFVVYMGTGYSMPVQLPLNVLTFFVAMRLSPSVRRFIHPIFPCAGITILGVFVFAAMKRESLDDGPSHLDLVDERIETISYADSIYTLLFWSKK